jgi:hypothetical protein
MSRPYSAANGRWHINIWYTTPQAPSTFLKRKGHLFIMTAAPLRQHGETMTKQYISMALVLVLLVACMTAPAGARPSPCQPPATQGGIDAGKWYFSFSQDLAAFLSAAEAADAEGTPQERLDALEGALMKGARTQREGRELLALLQSPRARGDLERHVATAMGMLAQALGMQNMQGIPCSGEEIRAGVALAVAEVQSRCDALLDEMEVRYAQAALQGADGVNPDAKTCATILRGAYLRIRGAGPSTVTWGSIPLALPTSASMHCLPPRRAGASLIATGTGSTILKSGRTERTRGWQIRTATVFPTARKPQAAPTRCVRTRTATAGMTASTLIPRHPFRTIPSTTRATTQTGRAFRRARTGAWHQSLPPRFGQRRALGLS